MKKLTFAIFALIASLAVGCAEEPPGDGFVVKNIFIGMGLGEAKKILGELGKEVVQEGVKIEEGKDGKIIKQSFVKFSTGWKLGGDRKINVTSENGITVSKISMFDESQFLKGKDAYANSEKNPMSLVFANGNLVLVDGKALK